MNCLRSFRATALVAAAVCTLPAHAAFVFTGAGQTVTTQFSGTSQGVDLAASVTYTLASYSTASNNKNAVFDVTVRNLTAAQPGANLLASFGVDIISPTLLSVSDTFSGFSSTRSGWFQSPSNRVDLCLYAQGSCSGRNSIGMSEGASQQGQLTLGFNNSAFTNGFSVSFAEPYHVRFVSVGSGDGEENQANLTCTSSVNCASLLNPLNTVPEPSSLALTGAALLAAAAWGRRQGQR